MSSYAPASIKGAVLEEVTLALITKGAVELAPLPSPGFYSRLFVVWKTSGSWRPVSSQSLCGRVALPDGDHPVCSSVCPSGGLDGLHRSSGSVSPGSCPSRVSSLPSLCGSWPRLPVECAALRSVHGPAGLHLGYDSCLDYPALLRCPYALLPGQLARPVLLPGGSPPRPQGCLVPLSGVGDSCQPGEIQLHSVSGSPVSRGDHQHSDFYGFFFARSRLQAVVNCWRISALRRASCRLVAVAAGDVVLPVASGSGGPPANAVTSDLPSPLLGSVGSVGSCSVVSRLPSGPTVAASRGSPLSRGVSPSGFPGPGLLVRRI